MSLSESSLGVVFFPGLRLKKTKGSSHFSWKKAILWDGGIEMGKRLGVISVTLCALLPIPEGSWPFGVSRILAKISLPLLLSFSFSKFY